MKLINKSVLFFSAALFLLACSKEPDVDYTSTYKMSGEWFVQYYYNNSPLTSHDKILTYNTSDASSGKIWVEDDHVWPFKAKADVDYGNLLVKQSTSDNVHVAGETVTFLEGKVIPGAGRSRSGVVVDSIYLKVEFSDDPGTVYEIRGHQRTGFFEDEF